MVDGAGRSEVASAKPGAGTASRRRAGERGDRGGHPARSAGVGVAARDHARRASTRVTGARVKRPVAAHQAAGAGARPGADRPPPRASSSGRAPSVAGRRGSRPRAALAASPNERSSPDAVEAVDRRGGVEHDRRGVRREAAPVFGRDHGAVGDADRGEFSTPSATGRSSRSFAVSAVLQERAAGRRAWPRRRRRRPRRSMRAGRSGSRHRCRAGRRSTRSKVPPQRLRSAPRSRGVNGDRRLAGPAGEQDERAGAGGTGRRQLGVGQRERAGRWRAAVVERNGHATARRTLPGTGPRRPRVP